MSITELLVSKAEASQKITAQFEKGRQINKSVTPIAAGGLFGLGLDGAFEKAQADQVKWAKYTYDLLQALFSGESIAEEFGGSYISYNPVGDKCVQFRKWMEDRIGRLESILERLDLFPVAKQQAQVSVVPATAKSLSKDIFIVHGHDDAAKQEVARLIEKLGVHAIILHEQPDKGRTIIEKFEHHADVGFAVVLLTPDDVGHPNNEPAKAKPRARQNVVLELGYFIGILGRSHVCALLKGGIEMPTDYSGVLYTSMDDAGAWKFKLAAEIKAAGIDVDLNKLT